MSSEIANKTMRRNKYNILIVLEITKIRKVGNYKIKYKDKRIKYEIKWYEIWNEMNKIKWHNSKNSKDSIDNLVSSNRTIDYIFFDLSEWISNLVIATAQF